MAPLLYLDTARLGQMSSAAQDVHRDFARFAGEVGGSIQFDDFLWGGIEACLPSVSVRYPGLAAWKGIAPLKKSLCDLTALPSESRVLLAARSAQLMKLAATLLCRPCRNVLVADTGWPPYQRILDFECRRTDRRTTMVKVCEDAFQRQLNEDEIVERVRRAYIEHCCDGLFLTAVSHLGIQLPVQKIVRRIERSAKVRFVVVDGAQDFCHVGSDLRGDCADLYLAGSHKWLGGYHPLGFAFYGKRRSRSVVEMVLRDSLDALHLDDPLLRFVGGLNQGNCRNADETVNLAALFSCQGAVSDAVLQGDWPSDKLAGRLENAHEIALLADGAVWTPQLPYSSLQSGIVLLNARHDRVRSLSPDELRAAFYGEGIALTAYEGGLIRLSMPAKRLQKVELAMVEKALRKVG